MSSELSSVSHCCLLCTNEVVKVQVPVAVEDSSSQKTPNPNPGSSSSSSSSPTAKLISHEQCSFVLFRHVLGRDLPPNICNDTQIKLCKNDSKICIQFCNPCLTQLTHIHDLVAQLARVERQLEEQKAELVLKFYDSSGNKVDPPPPPSPNSATSGAAARAAAAQLPVPENERQEFWEVRSAVVDGLKFLKPRSILAIVHNLKKHKRKRSRPTLPPALAHAHAQPHFQSRFGNSSNSASSSSVRLMKNVSIPRIQLRTRGSPDADDSFRTDPLGEENIGIAGEPEPSPEIFEQKLFCDSDLCVGAEAQAHAHAQVEGAELKFAESADAEQRVQIPLLPSGVTYLCGVCGAIFKDHESLKLHDDEHQGRRHDDDDDDARNSIAPSSVSGSNPSPSPRKRRGRPPKVAVGDQSQSKRKFKCTLCPAKFAHNSSLKHHLMAHRGEKPFQCRLCPARFVQGAHLKGHQSVHTGEKPFQCPSCPSRFTVKHSLRVHLESSCCESEAGSGQKIRKFKCDECPAKFGLKSHLKSHQRLHSGEKPFQCHLCPAKFCQSGGLRSHLMGHSGDKPFSCQSCFSTFKRKSDLKTHSKKFHPNLGSPNPNFGDPNPKGLQERPTFSPSACASASASGLQIGLTTPTATVEPSIGAAQPIKKIQDLAPNPPGNPHDDGVAIATTTTTTTESSGGGRGRGTLEKPFKCSLCPARFSQRGNLKRHLLVHSGENPFKCPTCAKTFRRKEQLRRHEESVHSEVGQRLGSDSDSDSEPTTTPAPGNRPLVGGFAVAVATTAGSRRGGDNGGAVEILEEKIVPDLLYLDQDAVGSHLV